MTVSELRRLTCFALFAITSPIAQQIPAAHVYHNHMPNFWPYYANSNADVIAKYNAVSVGAPINYTYDGYVINLKQNPPPGYRYLLPSAVGSGPMPHDDLITYYSSNANISATRATRLGCRDTAGQCRRLS